jgi:outer membrane biosynthesis protein TonB
VVSAATAGIAVAANNSVTAPPTEVDPEPKASVGDYNPYGPVPFSALQLANYTEPEFPPAYADQSIDGWVDVQFSIGTDGAVSGIRLMDTDLPPDFLAPSRAAVSQWRFKPFIWNGMAIAASTTVRLTYSN